MKNYIINAEAAIVSAMMNDDRGLLFAAENLTSDYFGNPQIKTLFDIIISMYNCSETIDIITIMKKVEQSDKYIEMSLLLEIEDLVVSAANIKAHYLILEENRLSKQTNQIAHEAIDKLELSESAINVIDETRNKLMEIEVKSEQHERSLRESTMDNIRRMEDIITGKIDAIGMPTNIPVLDHYIIMNPGNLIVIAAKKGVGKSALANQIAFSNALNGKKIAIFNMEMSQKDILDREISRLSTRSQKPIMVSDLNFGRVDPENYQKYAEIVGGMPGIIDDNGFETIPKMLSKMTRFRSKLGGLDLVVIDYLQLIREGKGDNRQQQLADISRELKLLAKEFNIPIIVLSQLNHDFITREAEDTENNADIVLKLFRPFSDGYGTQQKNGIDKIYRDGDWIIPEPEFSILKIDKNRKGATGMVRLYFKGENQSFYGWEGKL